MKDITRILVVEDLINDYELAQLEIRKSLQNCIFERVETQNEFLQALEKFEPDVILCEYRLPAFTGLDALELTQKHAPSTPLIIWTGSASEDIAVECMKKGASNYIHKANLKRLGPSIIRALEERRLVLEHKQAEEKYQSVFENSPVGVFQSTPEGKYLSANPALAHIYGFASPQEMVAQVRDIAGEVYVDPKDRQQFLKPLNEKGVINDFEMKNRKKDGSIFWTSTSARVVRDETGKILYYEGFLQDITQRKQAEEALKINEQRFRALIENGLDDISLLDGDGNLLWESPSTVRNLGYSPNQFLGQSMFTLMHPDDLTWVTELFKELIQKPGTRQHQSFRLKRSDGTWRWVEAITTNLLNEPSVQAIVVNYRDITERKEAEQAIRESEENYRLLFESNPMPMWIYDLETLRFLKVNDAAVGHYGYSAEEFLGMTIKDIRPSEDVPKLLGNIAQAGMNASQRVNRSGRWRHRKKDGTVILVDIISHSVEFDGRKAEIVLANDVTVSKQAEIEIQQRNEDLELINALNDVINRGESLDAIMKLLWDEAKRILSSEYTTIYLLNPDGQSLKMQQFFLRTGIARQIEKLIGRPIPSIEIPIQEGGLFQSVLNMGHGMVTSDPQTIKSWIGEFVETSFLSPAARSAIRKLVPPIFKILDIRSTILVPLISDGKTIGFLNVSSSHLLTSQDLKRIESISGQLTAAIRRKQVEDALNAERNLLRTLIDNLPDRIYVMDSEGRKTISNTADWKASGGKTMEDVIGKTDFDTYPPELAEQFWKLDKAVLDSGKPVINYEEPGLDFDGKRVSILTTKIPLRNEDGKVLGLVGVGRDITERKQVEEQINDLLVFTEKILNNSPVGILTYKLTGECVFANEQAALIVGAQVHQLKAQNFHTIESWKESGLYNLIEKAVASGASISSDIHHISSFGREVWMTVHCTTFRSNDEDHVLLSISDSTERKKAEQSLLESQAKYQNLVETSHDLIWAVDKDGRFTFLNRAAKVIYGYEPEELIGRSFFDILDAEHYDHDDRSLKAFQEAIAGTNEYQSVESYARHRDGRPIVLSANSIVSYDDDGNVIGLTGSSRDITGSKQVDTERQVLFEIMQGLANTDDLQEFLKLIHGAIAKVIYAENCFVVLHQPDSGLFEEIYSVDQFDPPAPPASLAKSITSYVFRSGQPLLITKERFKELIAQGEVELVGTNSESWLGVPLKTTSGTIGVIAVQDYERPNRYAERDKDFLASIASQVALAIERKRTEEAEREHRALAEALLDTAKTLNSTLDYREVLDRILEAAGRVVPHNAATIMIVEGGFAHVVRSHGYDQHGFKDEIMGVKLLVAETDNLRQILETGQPVIVYDTHAYKGWKRIPVTEWLRANVGAPISIYGEVIGFILLDSETVGFFTPVHARRLEAFANQAAIAIHNARLLQHAQEEIRERKRAEDAFKETSEQFRTLFEASPESIMLIDPHNDWIILDCNTTGCAMNGYTREELVGQSVDIFNLMPGHPAERSDYLESIRNAGILRFETSHRHKDGRVFPIEVSTSLITLAGREVILGIDRDITERKRAEQALRDSEEIYRQAIEVAGSVPYYQSYDDNGKAVNYEFIGEGIRQITGYGPEEFNTLLWDSLVEEVILVEDLAGYSLEQGIDRVRSGQNPIWKCEHRIRDRDGKIHWVFEAAVELRDENGISHGSIGTFQDITMRKQAEVELRASEDRFRQLASNIEEVFWMTDAETGSEVYMSPAGEKIWAQPLDHLMNEPDAFINTVFTEDKPVVLDALEREKAGEKVEVEYRILHPDGSLHWIWDRAFPIFGEDGHVKTLAGIAADITERKRTESDINRHLTELKALYENGLAVGRLLEPKEIGEHIISTFAMYLSWHHVAIRLLHSGTNDLEVIAFNQPGLSDEEKLNMERHFNQMISKTGQGLSGWAVQTGVPLRTGNVHSHPQYVDTQAGIESGLYMPLKIGDRIIGVISVESDLPNAFTEQDERLLATLASQAAVAFENARLYQEIQLELAERKRAEDALRMSETHYRDLADSITDILFEMDHHLRYVHWNKASELFTGIPAQDAIGRSLQELFGSSADSLGREEIYRSVVSERKAKMFQTEMTVGSQNQKRILEINAYPSARGVSVVAKDVTERKRNETLLERRFELMEYTGHHDLNEMMQKTVDIISELTGSHIGFYFFMDQDEKTLNMQICSTETMLALNVAQSEEMHLALDQAGVWAEAARQRRSVIHNDYESLLHKQGLHDGHSPFSRELTVPIIRNEKLLALISIGNKESDYTQEDVEIVERFADYAWDITERKQMENQLKEERVQLARRVEERTADLSRANSNLARALRVKDEFLANMSHELRTPLNAILGLSESLGEQVAGPLNEKQQKYLMTINESGHHLLSLINDILDLAKIEAGQITLDINKVDVNSVCQASLRMVKQLAQKKNQDLSFEIDDGLGLMWADERRLKQMLVNLLSNAVKFTPESSRLGLEVHGDRTGNKVTLTVWDNGIGITARDMERLFKPFVQLDTGLAREVTGTGLGLALVAQMARLHGGSVTVQSQPGEGSRFSIQLPWEPALASDAAMRLRNTGKFAAINPHAKNKPTILLIEDTKEVVMMITDYFEMAGYKIITAQDGVDGITQAKLSHPNLILMDIQMPRMDGFETTQKLRADPEFKDTPIIALTALAMSNDRQRCLEAGMDEYISKPINLKALAKMIRQFLLESKDSTSP